MISHTIEESGETLAAVVRRVLELPWSKAKDLCSSGRVRIDGERAPDPAVRVVQGQVLVIDPEGRRQRRGVLSDDALVHVDPHVIVVDKSARTLTLPFHGDEKDTLVDQVRAMLRRKKQGRRKERDPMVGVVQRLDKDTSGVIVFARTMKAKRSLQEQLREHSVGRRYEALVHGAPKAGARTSWIVPDRGDGLRGSWGERPHHRGPRPDDAKRCVTRVELLEQLGTAARIACRLETGRQHQIRIHLAESDNPLIGEKVYIRDFVGVRIEAPRQMLHAAELAFDHPHTMERVRFERAPPKDFEDVLRRLRGVDSKGAS